MLSLSLSAHDPGCVKTHTEKRCGKYNSLAVRRITPAQYDLTLTRRNCFKMFYACEARRSFHTVWVIIRKAQVEHIGSVFGFLTPDIRPTHRLRQRSAN